MFLGGNGIVCVLLVRFVWCGKGEWWGLVGEVVGEVRFVVFGV